MKKITFLSFVALTIMLVTLTSCQKKYKVTFDTDGGSQVPEVSIKKGDIISQPLYPTKEGYYFLYWEKDGKEYDFNSPVNSDITLKAIWEAEEYIIKFNTNGGNHLSDLIVKYGETIQVDTPVKENFVFDHWEKDGQYFDLNTPIKESMTLVASYEPIKHNVTIHYNNGEDDKVVVVNQGSTLSELYATLDEPVYEGYKFIGYYTTSSLEIQASGFLVVNTDMDIYVKFSKIYHITYHLDEGTPVDELTEEFTEEDMEIIDLKLPNLTKEGFYFRGWHEKDDFTDNYLYKIDRGIVRDFVLYAHFVPATLENAYFGIIGDSISTFEGYINSRFLFYPSYSKTGSLTVDETWWMKTIHNLGCKFGINNSYSGTCVMNIYGGWSSSENPSRLSYTIRTDNIPIDILVVFMGMNDSLVKDIKTADFEVSYNNMVKHIYEIFPNVDLFICTCSYEEYCVKNGMASTHNVVTPAINEIITRIGRQQNIPVIDFSSAYSDNSCLIDTVHPNALGMSKLAEVATNTIKACYEQKHIA